MFCQGRSGTSELSCRSLLIGHEIFGLLRGLSPDHKMFVVVVKRFIPYVFDHARVYPFAGRLSIVAVIVVGNCKCAKA